MAVNRLKEYGRRGAEVADGAALAALANMRDGEVRRVAADGLDYQYDAQAAGGGDVTPDSDVGRWYKFSAMAGGVLYAPYDMATGAAGALAAGDNAPWIPVERDAILTGVRAVVKTASTAGAISVDVEKSSDNGAIWTSILSTGITIDQDERDSDSAATPPEIDNANLAVGDLLRLYVDDPGAGAADVALVISARATLVV